MEDNEEIVVENAHEHHVFMRDSWLTSDTQAKERARKHVRSCEYCSVRLHQFMMQLLDSVDEQEPSDDEEGDRP